MRSSVPPCTPGVLIDAAAKPRGARPSRIPSPPSVEPLLLMGMVAGNDRSGHGAAAPSFLCRAREAADDAVLDGEQAGSGPVGDGELAVDVLDVVADGLLADEQVVGDAAVGPAPGDQAQHLDLPGGEPGRPGL